MSPQQQKPTPGDFTGRTKVNLAKDQADAVIARSAEMSMSNSVEDEAERNGVFDPKSGERMDAPSPSAVAVADRPPPQFGRPQEQVFTGHERPEEVEPALVARRTQVYESPSPNVVRSAQVVVRMDADVEDMTYGMTPSGEPNNFTFREGLKYEIPRDVADHLNDRGYIRQWVSG